MSIILLLQKIGILWQAVKICNQAPCKLLRFLNDIKISFSRPLRRSGFSYIDNWCIFCYNILNDTVYTLDGNKILYETRNDALLTYYYGGNGVIGFHYNYTDYFYRKNLQGDVIEIYTFAGEKVASYTYNAWGKVLAVNNYTDDNIGTLNPFRYRSYYYDTETNLYYLESRYYDSETGRFISSDDISYLDSETINGLNLYAYCLNNPVNMLDSSGHLPKWLCTLADDLKAFGRSAKKWIVETGQKIKKTASNFLTKLKNAITIDIGVGAGLGGGIDVVELEANAVLARSDFITIKKEAGQDLKIGRTDEQYFEVKGAGTSFPTGTKTFYDLNGNIVESEVLTPSYDVEIGIGGSIYALFGITFNIGIDLDYLLN